MAKGKKQMVKPGVRNNKMKFNVGILVPIVIYCMMIKYIVDLEKNKQCECSATSNRTKLKKLLGMWMVLIFTCILLQRFTTNNVRLELILLTISLFVFFYFTFVFFKYESEMYKAKCECSDDIKKEIFKYYLYIKYAILALTLLFIILLFIFNA